MKRNSCSIINFKNIRSIFAIALSFLTFIGLYQKGLIRNGIILSCLILLSGIMDFKTIRLKNKQLKILWMLTFLASSVIIAFLSQLILNQTLKHLSLGNSLLEVSIILLYMMGIWIATNNKKISILMTSVITLVFTTVDYYVYLFRGAELSPSDLLSFRTALEVSGNYQYPITVTIIYSFSLLTILCFIVTSLPDSAESTSFRTRCKVLFVWIIYSLVVGGSLNYIEAYHFDLEGAARNGYLVNFFASIKEIIYKKPDNYSLTFIQELETKYSHVEEESIAEKDKQLPDVFVIMNESFADLDVIGKVPSNVEVLPFFKTLSDNTIKGYALSSVFGGGTPNSEYEFLTGNSLIGTSSGMIPYQSYIREGTYSILSCLKQYDYRCIAVHPFNSKGWMRDTVYPKLGFDEMYFMESFPQKDLVRGLISDKEMYEFLLGQYKSKMGQGTPLFYFGITMQNHGGYSYQGKDFLNTVSLDMPSGNTYPDAEQYLSLIHESDKAVEYFINNLKNINRKVIVLFYGDHLPQLNDQFYDELNGGSFHSLDDRQKKYTIPFFIWTNYNIEEKEVSLTSINYLSNYLLDCLGIGRSVYNDYLAQLQKEIPAINKNGFFSKSNNKFLELKESQGEEKKALDEYLCLIYNSMIDYKNRNMKIFPVQSKEPANDK